MKQDFWQAQSCGDITTGIGGTRLRLYLGTIRKKIIAITIGAITAPKIIPNLNHSLFNGVNSFEFTNPKIRKIKDIIANQILIDTSYVNGQKLKIKKTTKKTHLV